MSINHQGTIELVGKRLIIRPFKESDYIDIHNNLASCELVRKYYMLPQCESLIDTKKFIKRISDNYSEKIYMFAIEIQETKEIIGIINTFGNNDEWGSCEIGYALGKKYWNKGYASEALALLLEYLFIEIGYNRIVCGYFVGNEASKSVMEKCHMLYEGIRYSEVYYQNAYIDVVYYYLLKDQYSKRESH